MAVTLCVLLWARQGHEADLIAYEDQVLQLLPDHGARVMQRARTSGAAGEPLEVHVLQFPTEDALDSYMHDQRRAALLDLRDTAVARTQVLRVDLV
jgi:uncharacterized protein (DUF1330 family)